MKDQQQNSIQGLNPSPWIENEGSAVPLRLPEAIICQYAVVNSA